ncbi:MAG: MmcQ/YjbR family DNA-binding protein [Actinobacteria bacterium]|nr:MmcQ/YjbR family DNA-binding protein [Actinomycetota bacterium]
MTEDELSDWVRARAEELPGVTVDQPFGPEVDVFRVRGLIFMLLSPSTATGVTLKSAPADAEALRETFSAIIPGYHMNKRHWITLRADGGLEHGLVAELVTEAYRLVVAKLPRSRRPVDPELFGRL